VAYDAPLGIRVFGRAYELSMRLRAQHTPLWHTYGSGLRAHHDAFGPGLRVHIASL